MQLKFRRFEIVTTILLIFLSTLLLPLIADESVTSGKTTVFVVSTLYKRHEIMPVYDLATLRKVILAIKPDVFVLDVTPDELKNEKVWPGKIEYTGVIFPLMKELKVPAYGSEPKEPLFSELSGAGGKAYKDLLGTNPQAYQAMDRHEQATYDALKIIWKSPADVNSEMTDTIIAGKRVLEEKIVGEVAIIGQRRWNEHHVARILDAVKENPGKRIVVLVGIENRYAVKNMLKQNTNIDLVEMESWLRENYRQ